MRFSGTVVEASEPFIQRHSLNAEVHGKVFVMQIVEIVVSLQSLFSGGDKFVKSCVPHRRTDTGMHQVKDRVDGMRRDDPVDQHT